MNTESILANISRHIYLSDREKLHFTSFLEERQFFKKDFVLKQNEFCSHIYFINSGILRAFYLGPDGRESTIMFGLKDWWVTDMHCFLNELPAMASIQAVRNSNILKLSKEHLDQLYNEIPQFNEFFKILMQNAYCREQLRTLQNLSLSSKERYEQFIQKYPEIAANVTLKQIASYLGITPEFLSTIRGKKS